MDHEEELLNAFRVLNGKSSAENKNEMSYSEMKLRLKNGKDPFSDMEEKEM